MLAYLYIHCKMELVSEIPTYEAIVMHTRNTDRRLNVGELQHCCVATNLTAQLRKASCVILRNAYVLEEKCHACAIYSCNLGAFERLREPCIVCRWFSQIRTCHSICT